MLLAITLTCAACGPREKQVDILQATNLRQDVTRPQNEHLILVDVVMRESVWRKVQSNGAIVEYFDQCPKVVSGVAPYVDYGIDTKQVSQIKFGTLPAYRVTFRLLKTNVPAEIPQVMNDINCVRLIAGNGYNWTSYYSQPIKIEKPPLTIFDDT